jgi:hypothetical protein
MATHIAYLTVTIPHRRMKAAVIACYILGPVTTSRMQGWITERLIAWVGKGMTVKAVAS